MATEQHKGYASLKAQDGIDFAQLQELMQRETTPNWFWHKLLVWGPFLLLDVLVVFAMWAVVVLPNQTVLDSSNTAVCMVLNNTRTLYREDRDKTYRDTLEVNFTDSHGMSRNATTHACEDSNMHSSCSRSYMYGSLFDCLYTYNDVTKVIIASDIHGSIYSAWKTSSITCPILIAVTVILFFFVRACSTMDSLLCCTLPHSHGTKSNNPWPQNQLIWDYILRKLSAETHEVELWEDEQEYDRPPFVKCVVVLFGLCFIALVLMLVLLATVWRQHGNPYLPNAVAIMWSVGLGTAYYVWPGLLVMTYCHVTRRVMVTTAQGLVVSWVGSWWFGFRVRYAEYNKVETPGAI